jgi:hypothetical protein
MPNIEKSATDKTLEVGQIIYLKPICNAARYSNEIEEVKITKLGNKYFEVCSVGTEYNKFAIDRFLKDTLQQDGKGYSPDWIGYLTKQEIEDERVYNNLGDLIRKTFDHWHTHKLSLDQLRRIRDIIEEGK